MQSNDIRGLTIVDYNWCMGKLEQVAADNTHNAFKGDTDETCYKQLLSHPQDIWNNIESFLANP